MDLPTKQIHGVGFFVYVSETGTETLKIFAYLVEVFWVVTPCSDVVGYQRFGGTCCLHLQGPKTRKPQLESSPL
jgi:hypothetical protein